MKAIVPQLIRIARWGLASLFFLAGMFSLSSSPGVGVVSILIAALLIPPFWKVVDSRTPLHIPGWGKIAAVLGAFMVLVSLVPTSETPAPQPPSSPSPTVLASTDENWASPLPSPTLYMVERVVDGDTIVVQIEGKSETLRLIGIDTPETVDPRRSVECFGKEASTHMKTLLEGAQVHLTKDVSDRDRYGRLLRYVYKDDIFINEQLVRDGYAEASAYPPDVKYQELFSAAESEARENKRGLWSDTACQVVAISSPVPQLSPTPKMSTFPSESAPKIVPVPPKTQPTSEYVCNCSKTCSHLSCAEAQYQLTTCGCSQRDGDHDGVACDSQCQ